MTVNIWNPATDTYDAYLESSGGVLLESGPDAKVSALTELTAFSGDETFYVVEDDDGTPASRRVTVENLGTGLVAFLHPIPIVAYKQYLPAANITRSNTSFGDLDATNLAVAFTVPASGKVLVRATFTATQSAGSVWMNLRESTTDLADSEHMLLSSNTGGSGIALVYQSVVTGLTPGASKTYKLGAATSSGTFTIIGNVSGTITTSDGGFAQLGKVVIEVVAVP